MFRFEHPSYLMLLLGLPVLLGLFVWYWRYRRQALGRFADEELLDHLAPDMSNSLPKVKFLLVFSAIPLLIMALANPQYSAQREEIKRRGIDLFIAMDVSRSMLARDIEPSRMDRARYFANALIDELTGNNIGIEFFTCTPVIAAPLTTDYPFLRSVVTAAQPGQISAQGTDIGSAIELAESNYREESSNHRALVVISDGEDFGGEAASQAERAYDQGLIVFTVGVGRGGAAPMPYELSNGREAMVRDASGNSAMTQSDPNTLKRVAEAGGGEFFPLGGDTRELVLALRRRIDRIEKMEFEEQTQATYDSYFYYFLVPGLLLLFIDYLIGRRSPVSRSRLSSLLVLGLLSASTLSAQTPHNLRRQGDRAYLDKDFTNSARLYQQSLEDENTAEGNHNLGNSLYQQGDYEEAAKRFEEAAALSEDEFDRAASLHNLGNARFEQQDYDAAIEAYQESLRNNPGDVATKTNLSIAIARRESGGEGDDNQGDGDPQDGQTGESPQQGEGQADPQTGEVSEAEPIEAEISKSEAERLLERVGDAETQTRRNVTSEDMKSCSSTREW
ncbi:MAG: tetratricopeptide repeat protein [Bacteroidota bacterium]